MPPASMVHRFCIMLHAIGSSQVQVIFMPPLHFSILMVQRGTIMQLEVAGMPAADIGVPIPVVLIMPVRSTIIVLVLMIRLLGME